MVLHEMEGTQYKIGGTLVDINESTNTCTVKFLNGRVENGIPTNQVYITEKFIDTIKKYGKKVASWLVKKVNGLLAIMNPDGRMDENSTCTPVNILIAQSNGELPSCIKFFPNDNQVAIAEAAGFSVDVPDDNEILLDEQRKEKNMIETFWHRVMGVAGTTDNSIEESVKIVTKKYYTFNGMVKKLNEAGVASMYPIIDGLNRKENNGPIVGTEELKALIKQNIDAQLNLTRQKAVSQNLEDINVEDPETAKRYRAFMQKRKAAMQKKIDTGGYKAPILLIWGAPGIGKTAIISQVLKNYKNDPSTPINLYLETVSCAGLDSDSFRLPNQAENVDGVKDPSFKQAVLNWLPMYEKRDAAYNQMMEDRFAKCMFMSGDGKELLDNEGDVYQGGVIFLDEVVRANRTGFQVIMNICDRQMNEKVLAQSWAIIAAANRFTDDPTQDSFDNLESTPILQRFTPVTYVPQKSEWLAWARSTNEDLGEMNIEPEIADFIEAMDDSIWYRTIDNGGYDKELKTATGKDPASLYIKNGGIYRSTWETLRELSDEGKNPLADSMATWNGRTWNRISDQYRQMLIDLLLDNPDEFTYDGVLARSIFENNYNGLDSSLLQEALEYVSDDKWNSWAGTWLDGAELRDAQKLGTHDGLRRMDFVHAGLIRIVQKNTGGVKTAPAEEMKEYYNWKSIFSDKSIIDSIFAKGELPDKYKEMDNAGKSNAGGFKWKDNSGIVRQVEQFILSQYPGGATQAGEQFKSYADWLVPGLKTLVAKFESIALQKVTGDVTKLSRQSVLSAFNLPHKFNATEFNNMFTVKGAGKYNDIVILKTEKVDPAILEVVYNMIKENKFCQALLNYTKYCIKIDFTRDTYNVIGSYGKEKEEYKKLIMKNLGMGQAAETAAQSIHNVIAQIYGQNLNKSKTAAVSKSASNKTIEDTKYLDIFKLLRICLLTAYSTQKKEKIVGQVDF